MVSVPIVSPTSLIGQHDSTRSQRDGLTPSGLSEWERPPPATAVRAQVGGRPADGRPDADQTGRHKVPV